VLTYLKEIQRYLINIWAQQSYSINNTIMLIKSNTTDIRDVKFFYFCYIIISQ